MFKYEESWSKIWCEFCNTPNWICDGDLEDVTKPDPADAICCYKCKRIFLRSSEEDLRDIHGIGAGEKLDDYISVENGRKNPDDK